MPTANKKTLKHIESLNQQLDNDIFLSLLDDNDMDKTSIDKTNIDTSRNDEQRYQKIQAKINAQQDYQYAQSQMQDTQLNLADYLNAVQMVITETFAHSVWVKAEIRSISSKGGHYYFELADKDDNGKITASCRGNLWRNLATSVIRRFENTTGTVLDKGLTVLLKLTANFHPQYGFSVTIQDIDPNYTLGDIAQKYQQALAQLANEGLLDLNKSLAMPFDIKNVLVIAPENAAGLGDFRADADRLHLCDACHFYYTHATFQGNHAPQEIRQALINGLKKLHNEKINPDLIVVIRGGGAVGDLAYLNDYELSALLAEQNIPVWVGIGHERDRVLLDEVAHRSFDTPSKVIVAIREHLVNITATAQFYFDNIEKFAKQHLQNAHYQAQQNFNNVQFLAKQQLGFFKQSIDYQFKNIQQNSFQQLNFAKQKTEQLREKILLQNPKNILQKGYAIVRDEQQQVVICADKIQPNQKLYLEFQDGQVLTIAQ